MKHFKISKEWKEKLKLFIGAKVNLYAFPGYVVVICKPEDCIKIVPKDDVAATQNHCGDEICYASFEKIEGTYTPQDGEILVCNNEELSNIYIARTIVFFSDFEEYIPPEKPTNWFDKNVSMTGAYDYFCVNPKSEQWKSQDKKYVNDVEAGLLLQFREKYYCAFSYSNAFVLSHDTSKNFFSWEEIEEVYAKTHQFEPL